MKNEQPFSGTFELDKEAKNTVRYAEWGRCMGIRMRCHVDVSEKSL